VSLQLLLINLQHFFDISLRSQPSAYSSGHHTSFLRIAIFTLLCANTPVPFGISVGDFIASIELIHDVLEALKESNGSAAQFQELIRELYSLERALLAVKALKTLPAQNSEIDAIKQAAAQCQVTVDTFLQKNKKFTRHWALQAHNISGKVFCTRSNGVSTGKTTLTSFGRR
jgi:hypothetical protein